MIATPHVFEVFDGEPDEVRHRRHVNTHAAHPVATVVGLRNVAAMEREELFGWAAKVGDTLRARSRSPEDHPHVGDVLGRGELLGIGLVAEETGKTPLEVASGAPVAGRCARDGVIIGKTTSTTPHDGNVRILAPPLVLCDHEWDLLTTTLGRAIRRECPASL